MSEYPQLVIEDWDGFGEVQFFPRNSRKEMAVGYTFAAYSAEQRQFFDNAVKEWADMYDAEADRPTFKAGALYLRNYFGALYGPLDANPGAWEAAIAEAIEMFGMPVNDKRSVNA